MYGNEYLSPHRILISLRVVYSLIIINKAGGLIFQRDFNTALNKLNVNDYLVLAGTFHGYIPIPIPLSYASLSGNSQRSRYNEVIDTIRAGAPLFATHRHRGS